MTTGRINQVTTETDTRLAFRPKTEKQVRIYMIGIMSRNDPIILVYTIQFIPWPLVLLSSGQGQSKDRAQDT